MTWYYLNGSDRMGPVDDAEFQRLRQQNIIGADTLVQSDAMPNWQPLREVISPPPMARVAPSTGAVACASCGNTVPESETFMLSGLSYCAACKPLVLERIKEGKPLPAGNAEELRQAHIQHEASVKSVGLLYYLGGVAFVLIGVAQAVSFFSTTTRPGLLGFAMFFLVFGIAEIVAGYGIRRLLPWARIPAGIISGFGLLGFPIGTIINAYILYLVFSKKGATVFSPEYHEAIARTPHIRYRTSIVVWILLGLVIFIILGVIAAAVLSGH